jgi:hypothetical protein
MCLDKGKVTPRLPRYPLLRLGHGLRALRRSCYCLSEILDLRECIFLGKAHVSKIGFTPVKITYIRHSSVKIRYCEKSGTIYIEKARIEGWSVPQIVPTLSNGPAAPSKLCMEFLQPSRTTGRRQFRTH